MLDDKKICICIPARYDSHRLPGKPLADISGKPMIIRVLDNITKSKLADEFVVLTDNDLILKAVKSFGYQALLTRKNHDSGTERIIEFFEKSSYDIYINVQGDEPLLNAEDLDEFIKKSYDDKAIIATPIRVIKDRALLFDYNVVKCVKDVNGKALYFSRQAIPAQRDLPFKEWINHTDYFQHIGVYYFSKKALKLIASFDHCKLSKIENLEQLKWLENGLQISCFVSEMQNLSIDTQEQLDYINEIWGKN